MDVEEREVVVEDERIENLKGLGDLVVRGVEEHDTLPPSKFVGDLQGRGEVHSFLEFKHVSVPDEYC